MIIHLVRSRSLSVLVLPVALPALLPVSLTDGCDDGPEGDCPTCVADFALYDPPYEDDGVWEEEVTALETLFATYGWTWERIGPAELNAGELGVGDGRRYRALIVPGGYAYRRDVAVDPAGEAGIRDFVAGGGSYVGFCAGSFWAAETVIWAESATGDEGEYNQAGDYQAYPYDLELLPGNAQGPFGWMPWREGTHASLEPTAIDTSNPTMISIGMPARTRFFYYGGPFFRDLRVPSDQLEVWATALAPEGTAPEASTGAGQPTIIRFGSGDGTVILFSYHPEILIDSPVDGVELSTYLDESSIDWDTGDQTQDQINLDSWNIVHAALQIAADEPVTPLTSLP